MAASLNKTEAFEDFFSEVGHLQFDGSISSVTVKQQKVWFWTLVLDIGFDWFLDSAQGDTETPSCQGLL